MNAMPRTHEQPDEAADIAGLAALLPVPAERDIPASRAALMKATLERAYDEAVHGEPAPMSRRRKLAWRVGAPALVLAAVGGTAAAVLVDDSPAPAKSPQHATCITEFTKTPKFVYLIRVGEGQTPEQACALQWPDMMRTLDTYPAAERPGPPPGSPRPVLVACIDKKNGGGLRVMPQPADRTPQSACQSLDMVLPDTEATYHGATADQVRMIDRMLTDAGPHTGGRCPTIAEMRTAAEDALAAAGVTGWTIDVNPESPAGAAFAYADPESGRIVVNSGEHIC